MNASPAHVITSILPLRLTLDELRVRLPIKAATSAAMPEIEFLVVDDCEDEDASRLVAETCREHGWTHVRTGRRTRVFNLARCRNIGIRRARGEHILFDDLDVVHPTGFYEQMLGHARAPHPTFNFVTVPVAYLTPQLTADIESSRISVDDAAEAARNKIRETAPGDARRGTNEAMESFAPASAILLVRRSLLFAVGLFDERFEGWGGEDRDMVLRLLAFNSRIEHGADFGVTTRVAMSRMTEYRGWRSLFAMHGEHFLEQGLLSVHLHHPLRSWRNPWRRWRNMRLAARKAKIFAASVVRAISPEVDPGRPATFIVGRNPHLLNGDLAILFGNIGIIEEEWSPARALEHLSRYDVERVLFWNEYARPSRKVLWDAFAAAGHKLFSVERGALPGRYYFDPSGFCIASTSYRRELWDTPLSPEEQRKLQDQIAELFASGRSVEPQAGEAMGSESVRSRLGLDEDTRLVFCAFQVAQDTATTTRVGDHMSYDQFVALVRALPERLPAGTRLVYRNHPSSPTKLSIPGALDADSLHINDVVQAANVTLTYNSGVSVLSIAAGVPVVTCGPAPYAALAVEVKGGLEELVEAVTSIPQLDPEARERYLYYLLNRFYSLGSPRDSRMLNSRGVRALRPQRMVWHFARLIDPSPIALVQSPPQLPASSPCPQRQHHLSPAQPTSNNVSS